MPEIVDNKINHAGKKIGWIDGHHVRNADDEKLGYYQGDEVWSQAGHKVAYVEGNVLKFENGSASISLEKINEEIRGTYPLMVKCAVHVLLEE